MNEEELQWLKEISTTTGISYSGDMTITTDFANKLIDYIKELEQLQNNWNELKEIEKEHQRINGELREELQKANDTLDTHNELINHLQEVIEEVREWLKYKAETLDEFDIPKQKETGAFWFSTRGEIDNLLQILDKGESNE